MKLTVTNTSPLPLYRQMYDQLAAQILRGEIAPGEVLPPIRTVAQELSVSLISVRRAWEELERDGFIHTAVGRGTFAAALGETDKAAMRRAILKEKLTDAAQFCAAVGASGEEAAALLREIGILTADGKLKNDMIRKYNQIDHYVELVAPMFEQDDSDEIVLLDCACGKSYLSFVMNYYIHEVLHRRCRVIGVDIKEHVIDESRAMAQRLGYHNMTFICADLRTYQPPKNVTAVISLHACDIATDLALGTAIRAKAKYIACVPCCHKELLDQYTMPGLEPLTKFGVFKARFNDVLTDSMRALKLEAEGYKVSVVEYISPLDTPKNLLIRATRTGKVNHRAKAEYDAVRRTLGTTSELDRRCAELDNEFFVTDEDLMG